MQCKVWCCGVIFFEEEGKAVSVTSNRFVEILLQFLKPKLEELKADTEILFQQDRAMLLSKKKF